MEFESTSNSPFGKGERGKGESYSNSPLEGELESNSPLGRRTKERGWLPQALLSTYIYRGRGQGKITTLSSVSLDRLKSSPILQILLSGLSAKPCRSFTSTSTTTPSCCWTLGGDLHHHLRCSLERGEEGRHRLRTRDRGRKCCRNAAPDDRLHQHTRSNLVRLWNL